MKRLITICFLLTFLSCKKGKGQTSPNDSHVSSMEIYRLENAMLSSGSLFRIDSLSSKYINPRPVDVWLPEDYSKNKNYAVLYMHDGQMLFDSTTTWNKQEWKVDEWASKLMDDDKTRDFIVVGVHNISEIRWLDLFPQKAYESLDPKVKDSLIVATGNTIPQFHGDDYLNFLVKELKPLIDNEFSTLTNKENTFVMGSSMGGLMSMYAICEYPEVFSGAVCISTHWPGAAPLKNNPISKAIFKYMESNLPDSKTHRLYFDYGTETLDAHYPQYAPRVDSIFLSNKYTSSNYKNLKFEGADHSESSWNKRLNFPLTFLLKN